MKTTKTETVETVQIICDHCGEPVHYSGNQCIVCGKHACEKCFIYKLRVLEIKGPRFEGLWHYQPDVPSVEACPGCENSITKGIARLTVIMSEWMAAVRKCRDEYNALGSKVAAQIERRERELEKEGATEETPAEAVMARLEEKT